MANVGHVTVPTGAPIVAWGATKTVGVSTVLFMNQDLNNYVYLGTQSTITPGGPGSVPLAPNGVFSGDASETWYVVGAVAGIQPLVVVPNGQSYFLGITQGLGNLAIPSVQSPNFVHLESGWQVDKNGNAEFNDVLIRGAEIVDSILAVEGQDGGSIFITNEQGSLDYAVILFNAAGAADVTSPPSIYTIPFNAGEANEISLLVLTSGVEAGGQYYATLQLQSSANDDSTSPDIALGFNGVGVLILTPSGILATEVITAVEPGTTSTPETFHQITLDTGWTAVPGYAPPSYRVLPDGNLQLIGVAEWSSLATAAETLNNSNPLPEAYRPSVSKVFRSFSGPGARGAVEISPAGVITMLANSTYQAQYCEIDAVLNIPPVSNPAPPLPPSGFQPLGPAGEWTLVFDDEFNYTGAPDPSRWAQLVGNEINGTGCLGTASCSTVVASEGLKMIVASATEGAYLSSAPSDGAGANGWIMPPGGVVETYMYVPGPSSANPYNWGGIFGSGQDWPNNGEGDLVETNESGIDVNYHYESGGEQQSGPYNPPGNWCNSWHTYTMERGESALSFYWDGTLVKSWATDDSGGGWSILPNNGTGGGGPESLNNPIIARYVRGWVAGGSGGGGSSTRLAQNVTVGGASGNSISASSFETTAGSTLTLTLVCWSSPDTATHLTSVTDSAGNTWNVTTSAFNNGNPPSGGSWDAGDSVWGFCAIATCIDAAAIDEITVDFTASSVVWAEGTLSEWADLPAGTVTVLGAAATETIADAVTEYAPPAVTFTAAEPALVITMCSGVNSQFTAASGGFTIMDVGGDAIAAYNTSVSSGTVSSELSGAASHNVPSGCTIVIGVA